MMKGERQGTVEIDERACLMEELAENRTSPHACFSSLVAWLIAFGKEGRDESEPKASSRISTTRVDVVTATRSVFCATSRGRCRVGAGRKDPLLQCLRAFALRGPGFQLLCGNVLSPVFPALYVAGPQ